MRTKNLRKERSSVQVKEPPAYGVLVSKKALLTCIAIDLNNKGQSPSKSFLADFKEINDDDKQDKQGSVNKHGEPLLFSSVHQWELLSCVVADMRSDRSTFFCNRASGLSARPQDQQSSENDSKEVSLSNSYSSVHLVPTAPYADDTI